MDLTMEYIVGFLRDTGLELHLQDHLIVAGNLAVRPAKLVDERSRVSRIGEPFHRRNPPGCSIAREAFHFARSERSGHARNEHVHLPVFGGSSRKLVTQNRGLAW